MMKKEVLAGLVKDGKVEVEVNTMPKLNKFARTRDAQGKRVACPYTGISKTSKMVIDVATPYVGEEEDDNNRITESWTQPTDVSFIKESVKEKGKFYLFGKLVKSQAVWKDAKGKVIDPKVLAEYLPTHKGDACEEIWLKIGLDKISK